MRNHQNKGQCGQRNNGAQKSGDKPCHILGHRHKWKEYPDNKFGNNYQGHESNANESHRSRDSSREREVISQDDNKCNLLIKDLDSESDYNSSNDDASDPGLIERHDSESADGEDTYLLRNERTTRKEKPARKTRASVIFSLEDKNGNTKEYLRLLDTGSTGGLISKDLVDEYGFQCEKGSSIWDTNAGNFKTGETTNIKGLRFQQFTNKRRIDKIPLYVNPNGKQRYKIIFELDFLIENKFDFLLSTEMINWQGVEILIHNNDTPREKNECATNGKQLKDNSYKKNTVESVVEHKNRTSRQ